MIRTATLTQSYTTKYSPYIKTLRPARGVFYLQACRLIFTARKAPGINRLARFLRQSQLVYPSCHMKRVLLLLLPLMLLTACEKQYLVPSGDVPGWLKEIIREAEAGEGTSSIYASDMGAWIRYKYDGNYYYEWVNPVMSSFPPVYDHDGRLFTMDQDEYAMYQNGKCCKKYVWKGSAFPDDYDEW